MNITPKCLASQNPDNHRPTSTRIPPVKVQPSAYTPYGFRKANVKPTAALGFNGEFLSAALECYALGNGHRIYNPRLMRFISPDRWSPFFKGGLNPYAYCLDDPVNAKDPSGRFLERFLPLAAQIGRRAVSSFSGNPRGFSNPNFRNSMYVFKSVDMHFALPENIPPLINRLANKIKPELRYALTALNDGILDVNIITTSNEADKIRPGLRYKYAHVIEDNRPTLIISGAATDRQLSTHPTGPEIWNVGASNHVYAAGYIGFENGWITLNNWSGHFLPERWRSTIVKNFLQNLNYKVRISPRHFG